MYLVDTDVISEARKGEKSNPGVRAFFEHAKAEAAELYLSVITIGELRRSVERIRYRGGKPQAQRTGAVAASTYHHIRGSNFSLG